MSRSLNSRTTAVLTAICIGIAPFWSAFGQTRGTIETPQPPPAPIHMGECNAYAARMDETIQGLDRAMLRISEESERECRPFATGTTRGCRPMVQVSCTWGPIEAPDNEAGLQSQECQAHSEKYTNMQACIRQVQAWQSQHAQQGSEGGIFQLSAVSYAQEAGGALPDLLTYAKSPMVAGIAEWGSKALEQKDYFDLAKSLLKLSSPDVTQEDRSNLMQSLGLTAAQSMPNVNPLSSVMMAVSVDIINGIYLKNMQALQTELAAFDASGAPEADPEELNMQPLYAEATPAGYQDASDALTKLQTMFSPDANTYIGSEVSWSARTQPSQPPPTYVYTQPQPSPSDDQAPPPPPPPSGPPAWVSVMQGMAQGYINAHQAASAPPQAGGSHSSAGQICHWTWGNASGEGVIDPQTGQCINNVH